MELLDQFQALATSHPIINSLGSPRTDVDALEEAKLIGLLVTEEHSFIQPEAQTPTGLIQSSVFSSLSIVVDKTEMSTEK